MTLNKAIAIWLVQQFGTNLDREFDAHERGKAWSVIKASAGLAVPVDINLDQWRRAIDPPVFDK